MSILLKNGLVYDGSSNQPEKKDIYIENGLIDQIEEDITRTADTVIDCKNLKIAPGFIDAHSHNDFFAWDEEAILPFVRQGITSQVVGNCGFSSYGIAKNSPHKELVGGGLFKIENPGSLEEFREVSKGKLLVNLIPLIGHGTVRISTNGTSASTLTEKQKNEMILLLEEGFKDGSFGASLGLMYEPGMYAPKDELLVVAKVVAKHDGILTVHPRANSKVAMGYSLIGKPHIEQALDEMIWIAEKTGVRLQNSHLIFVGKSSWPCMEPMLKKFYKAREKGLDVAYDMYPFTYGASVITVILPAWYLKLTEKQKKNAWHRFKLKALISITKKLLGIDFDDLVISYIGEGYSQYEGKSVAQIAKEEGINPFDMYLKLVDLSKGKGRIMLGKYYSEEIIKRLMNDELSMFMTDAWYEKSGTQNAGTYQAFPYFIQKSHEYNIPLEKVIHKMTGKTADRFGIKQRGYLKEGYFADVCVFDDTKMKINLDVPHETPEGISYVIVNGEVVLKDNQPTNNKPGIVLRK